MSNLEKLAAKSGPELKDTTYYKDLLSTMKDRIEYTLDYLGANLHPKYNAKDFLKIVVADMGWKKPPDDVGLLMCYLQLKLKLPLIPKGGREDKSGYPESTDLKFGDYTRTELLSNAKGKKYKKYFKDFYKAKRASFSNKLGGSGAHSKPIASYNPRSSRHPRYVTPGASAGPSAPPSSLANTNPVLSKLPPLKRQEITKKNQGKIGREQLQKYLSVYSKEQLAKMGIMPFVLSWKPRTVISQEEARIYKKQADKDYKIMKQRISVRMKEHERLYGFVSAMRRTFDALGIKKKHWSKFVSFYYSTMWVESRGRMIAFNKKGRRMVRSTASGSLQILNSTWNSTTRKWLSPQLKKCRRYRRWYNKRVKPEHRIDFEKLDDINFNEALPGLATPYKHAVLFGLYTVKGSRLYKKWSMPYDEIFDMLDDKTLDPRARYTLIASMYANWNIGHYGAKYIISNYRKGIYLPKRTTKPWRKSKRKKSERILEEEKYGERYWNKHVGEKEPHKKRWGYQHYATYLGVLQTFVSKFESNLKDFG